MYTYNLFCFGHNLDKDEKLKEDIHEFDIAFNKKIGNHKYELSFPYHGGADSPPCVLGTQITDDDGNSNYIAEVRLAKESDYINDYNLFVEHMIKGLGEDMIAEPDEDFKRVAEGFKSFLQNTKPEFYSVQVSS